ncbi:MAG: hypothetical protein VX516_03795, partial [Actinomycetota bacterium]|nr:hypothetical protein [Actinomycetota bacterium]MEE3274915.1 hypothetical protein [Actinomycetota bacterium]
MEFKAIRRGLRPSAVLVFLVVGASCGSSGQVAPATTTAPPPTTTTTTTTAPPPTTTTTTTTTTTAPPPTTTTTTTTTTTAPTTTTAQPTTTTTAPPPPDPAMLDSLGLTLTPVATLDAPLALLAVPGTDVLLAAERTGLVRMLSPRADGTFLVGDPVLDLTPLVDVGGEGGLLGLAISPSGDELYASFTDQEVTSHVIA